MSLKLLVLLVNQRSLGQKLVSLVPGVKIKQTSRFPVGYRPRLNDLGLILLQISTFGASNVAKTPGSPGKSTIPWLETCQPRARGENKRNFQVSSGLQDEIKRFGAYFVPKLAHLEHQMSLKLLVLLVNQRSLGQKLVSLVPEVKIKQTSRFPVGYRPRLSDLGLILVQISTFGASNVAKTLGSSGKSTIPWLETCQPRARGENKTNFQVSSGLQAEIKRFGAYFAPNQHIWSIKCR